MPNPVLLIIAVLLIAAWLLLDPRSSLLEKLKMAFIIAGVYVAIRLMQGLTLEQILSPFFR